MHEFKLKYLIIDDLCHALYINLHIYYFNIKNDDKVDVLVFEEFPFATFTQKEQDFFLNFCTKNKLELDYVDLFNRDWKDLFIDNIFDDGFNYTYIKNHPFMDLSVNKIAGLMEELFDNHLMAWGLEHIFEKYQDDYFKEVANNLVFCAKYPPDYYFNDFLSGTVQLIENSKNNLWYNKSVSLSKGLTWNDVTTLCRDKYGFNSKVFKERLFNSCSEPEKIVLQTYLNLISENQDFKKDFPALLPQAYVQVDSKTKRTRINQSIYFETGLQRADFLMIMPQNRRVIIEIDDKSHYMEKDGEKWKISHGVYARNLKSDRKLKLMGYDIYRIGISELFEYEGNADYDINEIKIFFRKLLGKYGII